MAIHSFAAGSDESRSVDAAIAAAKLTWEARFEPLFLERRDSLGGIEALGTHRALTRSDTGGVLGVHGGAYEPVQIRPAFGAAQQLVDAGLATITRAGSLDGGRKVTMELALAGDIPVTRKVGDVLRQTLTFSNSFDGTSPVVQAYTAWRLACLNGMTRPERSNMFRGRHTRGVHAALEQWRVEFGERRAALEATAERFRAFSRKKLNDKALVAYVREVLSEGAGANEETVVRGVDRIVELAHEAPGADPGTLWGGVNAITYWATHERGRSDDARAVANLFGNGLALAERATAVALEVFDHLPSAEAARAAHDNHATAGALFGSLLGKPARIPSEQADAE